MEDFDQVIYICSDADLHRRNVGKGHRAAALSRQLDNVPADYAKAAQERSLKQWVAARCRFESAILDEPLGVNLRGFSKGRKMARFLALYMGSGNKQQNEILDDATENRGMAAWAKWASEHQASIVDQGGSLGKTLQVDERGVS